MKNREIKSELIDSEGDSFVGYQEELMEQPHYVLKANESISRITLDNPIIIWIRRVFWAAIIVIIICSIIFQFNLFRETPIMIVIIIAGRLFIALALDSDYAKVRSPFEIRFYEDYFILYKEKYYDRNKGMRTEFNKFMYCDTTKCTLDMMDEKLSIQGPSEITWYCYELDGSISKAPSGHKSINQVMELKLTFCTDIDFKDEIEMHSPLKVDVINKTQQMEN